MKEYSFLRISTDLNGIFKKILHLYLYINNVFTVKVWLPLGLFSEDVKIHYT